MKTKVRNRKTLTGARTKFGVELEESGKEILAHLRGEAKLSTRRIVLPGDVDVRQVRMQTGMSQGEFARAFCIPGRFKNGNKGAGNRMRLLELIWL